MTNQNVILFGTNFESKNVILFWTEGVRFFVDKRRRDISYVHAIQMGLMIKLIRMKADDVQVYFYMHAAHMQAHGMRH
jgi:hypothetical protein